MFIFKNKKLSQFFKKLEKKKYIKLHYITKPSPNLFIF